MVSRINTVFLTLNSCNIFLKLFKFSRKIYRSYCETLWQILKERYQILHHGLSKFKYDDFRRNISLNLLNTGSEIRCLSRNNKMHVNLDYFVSKFNADVNVLFCFAENMGEIY